MPTADYKLQQLSVTDLSLGAVMTIIFTPKRNIQSDAIDGEEARGQTMNIALTTPERAAIKAILDRAAAKMDFRRAARALSAAVDLSVSQAGEP